ncbi:fatty-acid--CoA ligase FadD8 [Gordonia humi]
MLQKSARQYTDHPAVWCDGREQTHGELYQRASRIANALYDLGLEKGDRVALLSNNAFETVELIAGCAVGGFVRAGLYAHESGEVNAYLTELVDARAMFVNAALFPVIVEYLPGLEKLEHVIVFDGDAPDGTLAYESVLAAASPEAPTVEHHPDDLHVIRFSAGTTGRPKGIVHTIAQWMNNNDEYRWVTPQLDSRDAYLAAGQLTHAASLWLWPLLQVGGRIVVMTSFDAGHALELIETQRATCTLVVPTMITALLAHPDIDTRDLSSMRCLNYAASPIAERTLQRALDKFGPVLYQLYAQSECITITMMQPHEHSGKYLRSVGRPTPNALITIVGPDGEELPVGEVGEIAVSAPGQMNGLWKNPQSNAERHLPDGRLLTRDMGYLDADGYLFLSDRKEDMIISGGYNIWPAELENAIASHEAVREVCVVGVPHEKWGETPMAFVVLEPDVEVTESEIIEVTRSAVGSVKKVTSVSFVDALPKSGVGKILRREVKRPYWEDRDRSIN